MPTTLSVGVEIADASEVTGTDANPGAASLAWTVDPAAGGKASRGRVGDEGGSAGGCCAAGIVGIGDNTCGGGGASGELGPGGGGGGGGGGGRSAKNEAMTESGTANLTMGTRAW